MMDLIMAEGDEVKEKEMAGVIINMLTSCRIRHTYVASLRDA